MVQPGASLDPHFMSSIVNQAVETRQLHGWRPPHQQTPLTTPPHFIYNIVQMTPAAPLGEFEQIVLLAILRLEERAYGVTIRAEIAACTDREPAPGALYTTLDRLQDKGLVTSRLGDPTPQRGGRAKRFFTVTAAGVQAVTQAQRSYQRLLKGLRLLGGLHA
jgi:DNA-binding PadR family transcriptional regulator